MLPDVPYAPSMPLHSPSPLESPYSENIQKLVSDHELISKKLNSTLMELKSLKVEIIGLRTAHVPTHVHSSGLQDLADAAIEDVIKDVVYKVVAAV